MHLPSAVLWLDRPISRPVSCRPATPEPRPLPGKVNSMHSGPAQGSREIASNIHSPSCRCCPPHTTLRHLHVCSAPRRPTPAQTDSPGLLSASRNSPHPRLPRARVPTQTAQELLQQQVLSAVGAPGRSRPPAAPPPTVLCLCLVDWFW